MMLQHKAARRLVTATARSGQGPRLGRFHHFYSRRSTVHSLDGIVSSTSPLANEAGLRTLRAGGNAADAAVAAAAVLNVAEPAMTGLGGDVFCLFYDSVTRQVRALNGSGRSPGRATLEAVQQSFEGIAPRSERISRFSPHAVTVPGAAAAWVDIVEIFGSTKLQLAQVLAPAIQLAETGLPVGEITSQEWMLDEETLARVPNGITMLRQDPHAQGRYRAPLPGELFRNPLLAQTMNKLAVHGKDGFYGGSVAQSIVDAVSQRGGFLNLDDMTAHQQQGSDLSKPVSIRIEADSGLTSLGSNRALRVWENAPNGQGIIALMALGIIQSLLKSGKIKEFTPNEHNSARYLHVLISALRIAFADGARCISDPATSTTRVESLLSPEYFAERATCFDPEAALTIRRGNPGEIHESDTIYLAVTDAQGNACSLVNSLAERFGSMIIPSDTGIILHCRGRAFSLDPQHPNVFAPGKRPYSTIIPALVTDAETNALDTVFGVMGGLMQPQGHVQLLLNMNVFGMDPQTALDAPRICISLDDEFAPGTPTKRAHSSVTLETGIDPGVAKELERLGHTIKMATERHGSTFGRGQIIRIGHDEVEKRRVYSAGSDPRGDGAASPM